MFVKGNSLKSIDIKEKIDEKKTSPLLRLHALNGVKSSIFQMIHSVALF